MISGLGRALDRSALNIFRSATFFLGAFSKEQSTQLFGWIGQKRSAGIWRIIGRVVGSRWISPGLGRMPPVFFPGLCWNGDSVNNTKGPLFLPFSLSGCRIRPWRPFNRENSLVVHNNIGGKFYHGCNLTRPKKRSGPISMDFISMAMDSKNNVFSSKTCKTHLTA